MKSELRHLDSKYVLYGYFLFIFLALFFSIKSDHRDYGTFRAEEIAVVQKIIHPEYYNGEFFKIELEPHNPYFNYDYFVAFIAKKFGYTENLWELGKIFWIFEKGLAIVTLIILCNYIFNKDKTVLAIAITLFISFIDHEATQKSMAMPLYILSIYFFLRGKWIVLAIVSAAIFYLHIGVGVWWLGTVAFGLLSMFLIQRRVSFRQIMTFCIFTGILVSPVIYSYFYRNYNSEIDNFTVRYFYYTQLWQSSPLLSLLVTPLTFANQWLTFAVVWIGYKKLKGEEATHKNIMLLAGGAVGLYVVQFVFADILSNSSIILMQLTRAIQLIFILGILFMAFLLASHLKKGNYIFILIFLFMFLVYRTEKAFFISLFILILYEIFERKITIFKGKISRILENNFKFIEKIRVSSKEFLQQPVVLILLLLIVFSGPKIVSHQLKSHIKSIFHISNIGNVNKEKNKNESLENIADYINMEIRDKKALVLYPFLEFDFPLFIPMHDSFISYHTPAYNLFYNLSGNSEFKHILEDDLDYSLDKLFKGRENNQKIFYDRWGELWKSLKEDLIVRWKEKYGLTHVIRENELPLKFPVVYRNSFYSVYEIK
ncbi:MAG: hypothetical protein WA104_03500 [Thermodesulfovibrionales bacterium]